jgi:hypothetical protein
MLLLGTLRTGGEGMTGEETRSRQKKNSDADAETLVRTYLAEQVFRMSMDIGPKVDLQQEMLLKKSFGKFGFGF